MFGRVWSYRLNRGQNTGRDLPPLAPLPALVGASDQANSAGQVDQGGGWLYHLLVKLGVSPDTASTVTDLIVRPLEILLVVLIVFLVARYGSKVIKRVLVRVANQAASRRGSDHAAARVTTMSGVVANVWRFFVFIVTGAIVLGMLGINLTPLLASAPRSSGRRWASAPSRSCATTSRAS